MQTTTAFIAPAITSNGNFRYRTNVNCALCFQATPAVSAVSVEVTLSHRRDGSPANLRMFHDWMYVCATHRAVAVMALEACGIRCVARAS